MLYQHFCRGLDTNQTRFLTSCQPSSRAGWVVEHWFPIVGFLGRDALHLAEWKRHVALASDANVEIATIRLACGSLWPQASDQDQKFYLSHQVLYQLLSCGLDTSQSKYLRSLPIFGRFLMPRPASRIWLLSTRLMLCAESSIKNINSNKVLSI